MTQGWVTNPEPLTLFTLPRLERIYDRGEILRERRLGKLPRGRVDQHIAKVLPRDSRLRVEPWGDGDGDLVRVTECAYRPFYRKDLFAIAALVVPAPPPDAPEAPRRLPPPAEVVERLLAHEGTPYYFGGSAPEGSRAQARFLIERGLLREEDRQDPELHQILHSSGIDCSGLVNVSTDYHFFGDSKDVYRMFREGLVPIPEESAADPAALAALCGPGDLILFRGHVIASLGDGRLIQAVGDGINARTFAAETGWEGDAMEKYNRVVVDDAIAILRALVHRQGRRATGRWAFDDEHLMIVRHPGADARLSRGKPRDEGS